MDTLTGNLLHSTVRIPLTKSLLKAVIYSLFIFGFQYLCIPLPDVGFIPECQVYLPLGPLTTSLREYILLSVLYSNLVLVLCSPFFLHLSTLPLKFDSDQKFDDFVSEKGFFNWTIVVILCNITNEAIPQRFRENDRYLQCVGKNMYFKNLVYFNKFKSCTYTSVSDSMHVHFTYIHHLQYYI